MQQIVVTYVNRMRSNTCVTLRATLTLTNLAPLSSTTATVSEMVSLVAAAAFFAVRWALAWFVLDATVTTLTVLAGLVTLAAAVAVL